KVVQDYSRRKLTKQEDVFAALAGITTYFQECSSDVPVAGLWKRDLHFGLLWSCRSGWGPVTKSKVSGVPSWSWPSVGTSVCGPSTGYLASADEQQVAEN